MEIAWSKTREQFPLSEKKILKKSIGGLLGLLIVAGIGAGFAFMALVDSPWQAPVLIGIGLVWLLLGACSYGFQRWYFAVYYYELAPDYVVIRKGPITPHEITIPYERIQDVYVDQDLIDRFFGLYDVHLSSATASSGIEAHIDGVEKASMEGLRQALLETVKDRISKRK
jgi:membrane protein YdbS with pleckstrin-like domain